MSDYSIAAALTGAVKDPDKPLQELSGIARRAAGYSPGGEICSNCQGMRLTRNGGCLKCEDCGTTTGCS